MCKKILPPISLYIHIPWCIKKCPYCDFNSHAVKGELPEIRYIDALLQDLSLDLERFAVRQPTIGTIFIGGGTPSLFSPEAIDRLLCGIRCQTKLADNAEITLEANPGTFESGKFAEFRAIGINRLSIGVQSFNDEQLKKLGRVHSSAEAIHAAEIAQRVGFSNFNLDLMFGLPEISGYSGLSDIRTAVDMNPTHISFYQLTLEPNTYFHKFPPQLPGEESIFAGQMQCQALLESAGYWQYEISAYSKPGAQCRHNRNYWQFGDYLGIGAGAHGKISLELPFEVYRSVKPKSPELYMQTLGEEKPVLCEADNLPIEFAMNHFRLKEGFTEAHYRAVTGLSLDSLQPGLEQCIAQGLVDFTDDHYRCSEHGWNFLDTILEKFIR
ncbi:radical SAM family heme chaperone HemW [Methylotuvimicrobium alcaliphilum]|uniref:Heme chaperone HemW n=1 Tax=Methylotuvimicrobium alcaliphilum (strain DSM 19304 / NCIMB 14124 / VKM B-2133 / 20Z) TaxID=1091494 RepID=G4SV80_META2|nr:radical SAM family heme chaperone HemW [Methylotuvimicrobium alcaliphilum]CCE21856.1 Oxygen-independent coproporphyrinogen-III oxidase-like protein yggW [Methylotuvimicrobium alcaliphilum 20Z]